MTIDNKIAIAALIIAFTSPFVKALAERWIAKPVAIPEANKPSNQNQPKSRFRRFLMSEGLAYFLIITTLLWLIPFAWLPLTRFSVFVLTFVFSSASIQLVSIRINHLRTTVGDLISIVHAQEIALEGATRSVMILSGREFPPNE